MATAQQLIDAKYDYQLLINQKKLREIFSPLILAWGEENNLVTFEDYKNFTGVLILQESGISDLKGLNYLENLTELQLGKNNLSGSIDVSNLVNVTKLYVQGNADLEHIGYLDKLKNVQYLNVQDCNFTELGNWSNLTSLLRVFAQNNSMTTAQVDEKLEQLNNARIAGAPLTFGINISGNSIPTLGVNNADYIALTGAGISVIIDS